MIEAMVEGKRVWVAFTHKRDEEGFAPGSKHRFHGLTICSVYTGGNKREERTLLGQFAAYCSTSEPFQKEKGRKAALKKTLIAMWPGHGGTTGRTRRTEVWKAYFERK